MELDLNFSWLGNTWRIQSDKRGVLKYYQYFLVAIIYIINVAKTEIYKKKKPLDNL